MSEDGKERFIEKQEFESRLQNYDSQVRDRYARLLVKEQVRLSKENDYRPVVIPYGQRYSILDRAIAGEGGAEVQKEELASHVKPVKIKRPQRTFGTFASHVSEALDRKADGD